MKPSLWFEETKLAADPRAWNIVVVLPTRDEAATTRSVIEELRVAFQENGLPEPVIVIADDSCDETRHMAAGMGVRVVNGEGKGLGFAMQKGLKAALTLNPDVVCSMDADGQSDPREIMKFLEPLARREADMVLGSRFLQPGLIQYRYRAINRLGTIILAGILRRVTGLPLTDSHGGLRAMRAEVVRHFDILGTHTYVQETIIDAHQKGFRIKEVPSVWRKRERGKSRVVGSIPKYIMYTLPILMIRSGMHVRWLYRLAFWIVVAAVVYFVVIFAEAGFSKERLYDRIPALLCIAMMGIIGIQIFTVGFLAEMLRLIKAKLDQVGHE